MSYIYVSKITTDDDVKYITNLDVVLHVRDDGVAVKVSVTTAVQLNQQRSVSNRGNRIENQISGLQMVGYNKVSYKGFVLCA